MTQRINFRPAEREDYAFALKLYLMTMMPITAELMVWDESKQIASLARQWKVADVQIIRCDGRDVGWMQSHETTSEIFLQQLFIAPDHQRKGIGSKALTQLLTEWDSSGKPVTLTVLRNNPARRLYERFGFAVVDEIGVKLQMKRQPPT
jgi:ribosomal protein S18 acetylase RimI-like enzyme